MKKKSKLKKRVNFISQYLKIHKPVNFDTGLEHGFTFNEAISFMVKCESQEEIDGYWEKLSAIPEAEQCGWLKARFGLSWRTRVMNSDFLILYCSWAKPSESNLS